jgi:hypothetical protein
MPAVAELAPNADESQEDFTDRVHNSLGGKTSERQQRAFEAWEAAHGDPLQQLGIKQDPFDPKEFIRVRNVPVFAEHTTKDKDGNPVVYDRSALAAIADRCNQRIADTGDFAPLTAGHTPDREQLAAGREQPKVLGYVGPYRLGKIGNAKERWAIFADEWHHKNERPTLEKLRRRSPEVWLEERMEDRILDPIAALGAETPRLDLGLTKLCRVQSATGSRDVAKYQRYPGTEPYRHSMAGATFPGAMNAFVPGGSEKKPKAKNAASIAPGPRTPGEGGALAYAAGSDGATDAEREAKSRVRTFGDEHHVQHLIDGDPAHWQTTSIHPSVKDAQSHLEKLNGAVRDHYARRREELRRYLRDTVERYYHDATYGNQTSTGPLSPQAIDQLVMALMQTEPLQYLLDLMQQGPQHAVEQEEPEEDEEEPLAPAADEGDEAEQIEGQEVPEPAPQDEHPQPEPEQMAAPEHEPENPIPEQGEEQLADQPKPAEAGKTKKAEEWLKEDEFDGDDEKKHYASMDDDEKCAYAAFKRERRKKKYEATGVPDKPLAEEGTVVHDGAEPEKLSRATNRNSSSVTELQARYARMEREQKELIAKVEQLTKHQADDSKKLRDADRYARLQARRQEFAFDVDTEYERIKDWPDEIFDQHVDGTIVANYQRMPIGVELYVPPLEAVQRHAASQQEKKEIAEEATRRALKDPAKYSYESALAEVRKERNVRAAS